VSEVDYLEPVSDAAKPVVERADLEKLSIASPAALWAAEIFNPVGENHAEVSGRQRHGV